MRRILVVVVVVLLGLGCSSTTDESTSGTDPVSSPAASRPFEFEQWNEVFVDASRSTEAGTQTPGYPERTLETAIYVPAGTAPRPLIVFSHGLGGHPDKFTALLSAWARAGYVVAAPAFPTTNDRVPGVSQNFTVAFGQPGDVSFVLDEVLRLNDEPTSRLHDRVDVERIGAGGLSLGGGTTYAAAFSDCCRDERIKAVEILAGARFQLAGDMTIDGHVPLLIVHGDKDPALRYDLAVEAYDLAEPPVWFVTLLGAAHAPAFEDDVTPHDAMVEQLTTDFWDATIGGDTAAFATLERHGAVDGLSTLQSK